jgi:hypothetical protein
MFNAIRIQRLEGLAWFVAGVFAFEATGWVWWYFAILLIAPDLSMLGYLIGPRLGALGYNLGHTLVGPAAMIAAWFGGAPSGFLATGAIWLAHIGADRAFGYGLKSEEGFAHTHLGMIGKK